MSPSPVEFVKSLLPSERKIVLESLIEDIYADHGPYETVPLNSATGRPLGILLPPGLDPEWLKMLTEMPPEMRDNVLKPPPADFDPDNCLTDEELEELTEWGDRRISTIRTCRTRRRNQPRRETLRKYRTQVPPLNFQT